VVDPREVTVVVPTYRREPDVTRCLGALAEQDVDGFEILVVDNGVSDSLRAAVERAPAGSARAIRYLPEPSLGLHNARHAGARAASGSLLLYIDDDATAAPGWLRAYCELFADEVVVAAGGPVLPAWEVDPPEWLLEASRWGDSFSPLALMDPDAETLGDRAYFFGANMAIRRDVLFELGGFHPEAFGSIWLGDGESGLNQELWRRGLTVRLAQDAVVRHRIPQQRMTLSYLRLRMRNEGAAGVYATLHPFAFRRRGVLRVAIEVVRTGWRSWLASAMRNRRMDESSLRIHMRAAVKLGELQMAVRLLRSRELWPLVTRERWLEADERSIEVV
jgi:glycosyltransferase involved in cell wall biosynthesis